MKTIHSRKTVNNENCGSKSLKVKGLTALGCLLMIGLSAFPLESAPAKDSGFKLMMTPKWTGFPYFELAAKGGKAAADELGDTFTYAGADHADPTLQVETLQNFLQPDVL
jgi:rhamnose transport system substrate-binding protein